MKFILVQIVSGLLGIGIGCVLISYDRTFGWIMRVLDATLGRLYGL